MDGIGMGEEDAGAGMQCSDHPCRNNPGGICAFCLQVKLGMLVSSSVPLPIHGYSSSSSSPSFRSDIGSGGAVSSTVVRTTSTKVRNDGGNNGQYQECYTRRARIPFLLTKKKKIMVASSSSSDRDIAFKRSKSTTVPATNHFLVDGEDFSPRRRGGFWSFLYLSSSKSSSSTKKTDSIIFNYNNSNGSMVKPKDKCLGDSLSKKAVAVEDDESPDGQTTSSFERKVSRSRSVGCGSRSFSGDFFKRISTGFGDCTLRRVESQREGKPKVAAATSNIKERVKCGGIFGGFMTISSSYCLSSSAEDINGKSAHGVAVAAAGGGGPLAHGRSRSWGRAFASTMRAFTKPSSKDGKRDIASNKNPSPNLSAIASYY